MFAKVEKNSAIKNFKFIFDNIFGQILNTYLVNNWKIFCYVFYISLNKQLISQFHFAKNLGIFLKQCTNWKSVYIFVSHILNILYTDINIIVSKYL